MISGYYALYLSQDTFEKSLKLTRYHCLASSIQHLVAFDRILIHKIMIDNRISVGYTLVIKWRTSFSCFFQQFHSSLSAHLLRCWPPCSVELVIRRVRQYMIPKSLGWPSDNLLESSNTIVMTSVHWSWPII